MLDVTEKVRGPHYYLGEPLAYGGSWQRQGLEWRIAGEDVETGER
jgi:hypothetical protein